MSSCTGNEGKKSNTADSTSVQRSQSVDTTGKAVSQGTGLLAGERLPILYITNLAANDMLQKLLTARTGRNKQKLICQFSLDKDRKPQLLLIPTASNNRDYILEDAVMTKASDSLAPVPLPADTVIFGALQFADRPAGGTDDPPRGPRNDAFSELGRHIFPNNNGYKYIWLIPEPKEITEPQTGTAVFRKTYVVYRLAASNDSPEKSFAPKVVIELDYANPSPPRREY